MSDARRCEEGQVIMENELIAPRTALRSVGPPP